MKTAVGTAATACAILLVLGLFGLYQPGTPIGNVLVSWGIVAPATPKEVADNGKKPEASVPNKEAGKEAGKTDKEGTPADGNATDVGQEPTVNTGTGPAERPSAAQPAEKPTTTTAAGPPAAVVNEAKPPEASKATPKPDNGTSTESKAPPLPIEPKPTTKPKAERPVAPPPKAVNNTAQEPAPLPPLAEPEPLGRLLSSEQVLLSDNPPNGWTRVGANQMLVPQRVLALPTYRPKIVLTSGVTVEMLGGTRIDLLSSSAKELPGIRVLFGRVVLVPLGKAGTRLRVEFGEHHGTITFVDAESIAALEVHHLHPPGTNPESESARATGDLLASGGAISWEETVEGKAEKPQRLAPSQRLSFAAETTGTPVAAKEVPKWITGEGLPKGPLSPREQLDRRASPVIAQSLPTNEPARIKLLELFTSRPQWEVKWLSLRCLGYVGQFQDMVMALNDIAQKPHWQDHIDALRNAVDRDAETAAAVRMALEKRYPQQAAAELYRMLWGYTDKQLEFGDDGKGGDDAKLVLRPGRRPAGHTGVGQCQPQGDYRQGRDLSARIYRGAPAAGDPVLASAAGGETDPLGQGGTRGPRPAA